MQFRDRIRTHLRKQLQIHVVPWLDIACTNTNQASTQTDRCTYRHPHSLSTLNERQFVGCCTAGLASKVHASQNHLRELHFAVRMTDFSAVFVVLVHVLAQSFVIFWIAKRSKWRVAQTVTFHELPWLFAVCRRHNRDIIGEWCRQWHTHLLVNGG